MVISLLKSIRLAQVRLRRHSLADHRKILLLRYRRDQVIVLISITVQLVNMEIAAPCLPEAGKVRRLFDLQSLERGRRPQVFIFD